MQFPRLPMSPHYDVTGKGRDWTVRRVDATAHIGKVTKRKEAIQIARLLAGWGGKVTVNGKAL